MRKKFAKISSMVTFNDSISFHAQYIIDEIYKVPYNPDVGYEYHGEGATKPIARIHHGGIHVSRAAIFAGELCKILVLDENITKLVQLAVIFHDSGREGDSTDKWDRDSAENLYYYLVDILGVDKQVAKEFAEAVANKDTGTKIPERYKGNPEAVKRYKEHNKIVFNDDGSISWEVQDIDLETYKRNLYQKIVHDADCMDIFRVKSDFDERYLEFYEEFKNDPEKMSLLNRLIEIHKRLTTQVIRDKSESFDCAVVSRYENAPNCYDAILKEFQTLEEHRSEELFNLIFEGERLTLKIESDADFLGGTGELKLLADTANRHKWLFKAAKNKKTGEEEDYRVAIQEAAYHLQTIVDCNSALPVVSFSLNGVLGTLQPYIEQQSVSTLKAWQNLEERPILDSSIVEQLQREHVTDWLIGNFDARGDNFILGIDGRSIIGIDKEQGFRFIGDPRSEVMSFEYNPNNATEPIYNTVFRMYSKGRIQLDPNITLRYIKIIELIPDIQYCEMFRDYAKKICVGDRQKEQRLLEKIVQRKRCLRDDYRRFYRYLISLREMKNVYFVFEDEGSLVPPLEEKSICEHVSYVFKCLMLDNYEEKSISTVFVTAFVNLYRKYGNEAAMKLTNEDIKLLQIAALFYVPIGTQVEMEANAKECFGYLRAIGVSEDKAKCIAEAMLIGSTEPGNNEIYRKILDSATRLGYMNVNKEFKKEDVDFYLSFVVEGAGVQHSIALAEETREEPDKIKERFLREIMAVIPKKVLAKMAKKDLIDLMMSARNLIYTMNLDRHTVETLYQAVVSKISEGSNRELNILRVLHVEENRVLEVDELEQIDTGRVEVYSGSLREDDLSIAVKQGRVFVRAIRCLNMPNRDDPGRGTCLKVEIEEESLYMEGNPAASTSMIGYNSKLFGYVGCGFIDPIEVCQIGHKDLYSTMGMKKRKESHPSMSTSRRLISIRNEAEHLKFMDPTEDTSGEGMSAGLNETTIEIRIEDPRFIFLLEGDAAGEGHEEDIPISIKKLLAIYTKEEFDRARKQWIHGLETIMSKYLCEKYFEQLLTLKVWSKVEFLQRHIEENFNRIAIPREWQRALDEIKKEFNKKANCTDEEFKIMLEKFKSKLEIPQLQDLPIFYLSEYSNFYREYKYTPEDIAALWEDAYKKFDIYGQVNRGIMLHMDVLFANFEEEMSHAAGLLKMSPNVFKEKFREKILKLEMSSKAPQLFIEACEKGDKDKVMQILDMSKSLRVIIDIGIGCKKACDAAHVSILEILLKHPNVDVNEKNLIKYILEYTCEKGDTDILKMLLEKPDIDFNKINTFVEKALEKACNAGSKNVIEILLNDPRIDFSSLNVENAFAAACSKGHRGIVNLFLKSSRVDLSKINIDCALDAYASMGYKTILKMLLEDPRIDFGNLKTGYLLGRAIERACDAEDKDILELLLKNSHINFTEANLPISRLFEYACDGKHTEIVELIFANPKIDFIKVNIFMGKIFEEVCSKGNRDIAKLILTSPRTNFNKLCGFIDIVIEEACLKGNEDILELLFFSPKIDFGEVNIGVAFSMAFKGNHKNIIELLLRDSRINLNTPQVNIFFRNMCFKKHIDIVELFIKNGFEIGDIPYGLEREIKTMLDAKNQIKMMMENIKDMLSKISVEYKGTAHICKNLQEDLEGKVLSCEELRAIILQLNDIQYSPINNIKLDDPSKDRRIAEFLRTYRGVRLRFDNPNRFELLGIFNKLDQIKKAICKAKGTCEVRINYAGQGLDAADFMPSIS